ncbi:M48 family metalloprotease, partial [Tritonibacter sp. SIMBA_163]|uniref:M48 family metalloprotease n=1 Tax=Tritonibacter sp. SIMBA_163 TaxID=3080868 RepID=UPI0039817B6C
WTFTILDWQFINAFALPGGYVYVTRCLITLAENEAQLAGVLAHEIGHVTARHSAERYGSSQIAGLATVLSGILLGQAGAQATGGLSQ